MRFKLRGARLVDVSTDRASGAVIIDDGKLAELTDDTHDADSDVPTFDVDGMILTPGFLDIHTHAAVALICTPATLPKLMRSRTGRRAPASHPFWLL